jgi:hypothetical protein
VNRPYGNFEEDCRALQSTVFQCKSASAEQSALIKGPDKAISGPFLFSALARFPGLQAANNADFANYTN